MLRFSSALSQGARFDSEKPRDLERSLSMAKAVQKSQLGVRGILTSSQNLSNLQSLREAVYRLGFDYSPQPNLSLFGVWSDSRDIQIGVRWNSERTYVGAQGRYGNYSNLSSVGSYFGVEGVR